MITFYLGEGSSAAAIKGGKSVDTSMGFTPLEGLMMSTRSGDVSAGIIIFLLKNGWTIKELERTLNHESGLLGVSGESENFKEVMEHALAGDAKSRLAVDMYVYRARKYLGAYWLGLPGLAAVSLTGDVAEEIPYVRRRIFENLESFGIDISKEKNDACVSREAEISSDKSRVKVFVMPRSGDLLIARETYAVVNPR
jgi:acetate kinase